MLFKRTKQFVKSFEALSKAQKSAAKKAFKIFKANPTDSRLRPHKINRLTSLYGKTIRSVVIESDLRVIFYVEGNVVVSVDIGTHDLYK